MARPLAKVLERRARKQAAGPVGARIRGCRIRVHRRRLQAVTGGVDSASRQTVVIHNRVADRKLRRLADKAVRDTAMLRCGLRRR